jgi:hypothetical protein
LEQYDEKKPATKPATQNTQNKDYSKSVTVEQQPNDDYWGDAVIPETNFDFDDNSKPKTEENNKKNNVQNPATEKQLALLRKKGVISDTDIVTKQEASVLIGNMFK